MKKTIILATFIAASTIALAENEPTDIVKMKHDDGTSTKITKDGHGISVVHKSAAGEVTGTEAWGKDYTVAEVHETHNSETSQTHELSPLEVEFENQAGKPAETEND